MQRHARITQEAAFGTYAPGGATTFPRLGSPGSFSLKPTTSFATIMDGLGRGVQQLALPTTRSLTGQMVTEIGPTNAPFLVPWACTRINSGQTSPWTTAELPFDLASCTIDFAHEVFSTATLSRKRSLGIKVSTFGAACSTTQPKLMGTFSLIGSKRQGNPVDGSADPDATAFPVPACSVFPEDCYQHFDLSGSVTILGAARTNFDSWSLRLENTLEAYFDESRFATSIRCTGRALVVTCNLRHKSTPDDWTSYEQGTAGAASFTFTQGGHTLAFDLKGKCYISGIDEDQAAAGMPYYTLTIVNQLDSASCTDFTVATT